MKNAMLNFEFCLLLFAQMRIFVRRKAVVLLASELCWCRWDWLYKRKI